MKKIANIAILDMYDGHPNEGMRCIKRISEKYLKEDNTTGHYKVFDTRGSGEVPKIEDYNIFISTGGPGNPILTGEKWESSFFTLIDEIEAWNKQHVEKKYVLLICHSFQLMVQHWNVALVNKRKSTSFGIMPIHKTYEGIMDPIFDGLDNPFWAVDSRDFQVVQFNEKLAEQKNVEVLAIEKERPHIPLERAIMSIRFTREIYGVQFHPEADAEGMKRYFEKEEKRNTVIKEYGLEKYNEMLEHLEDPDKILLTEEQLIPSFLYRVTLPKHRLQTT